MNAREAHARRLRGLADWRPYLVANSGLPGPRGNIELAQAVADVGPAARFRGLLAVDAEPGAPDHVKEYLVFCGVLGLGALAAGGDARVLAALRRHAADPRWRVREAVAMALQRVGTADMDRLLRVVRTWLDGGWLELRAVAAGLCEPVLLGEPRHARRTLAILDRITRRMAAADDRRGAEYRALRKGMGYCWSVAIAADPETGLPLLERWAAEEDPDVRWMVKSNLAKKRLAKIDPARVRKIQQLVKGSSA